jgi:molybdate transport system permease protein
MEERGLVRAGTARVVAENELVVVVPRGAEAPRTPAELNRLETLGVAGENVPAGRYAREALALASVARGAPRLVTGGSVRGVLEWVARGEVDGGVVYRTDALAESQVEIAFAFGGPVGPNVQYWAAPLVGSLDPDAAARFVEHLTGLDASATFLEAGFRTPSASVPVASLANAAVPSSAEGASLADRPALPSAWSAVRLSLFVALLATALGLLPAVGLGWLLARHDFRGKTLVSTLVLSPLVMPPVVTGFLLLTLLGSQSPLGRALASLGLPVPFTILGAAIAAFVVGLPLYVLSIRGAFEAVDAQYEALSWTLGVPPWPTFLRISLPLAMPGIAAGAVLAFARALGEFGATIVLAGNVEGATRTIPLAVYSLLESPSGRDATWVLVGASVALSLLALLGFEALSRRQRRRLEHDRGR